MSLPEPYYSDGTTTLFHGDCVEVMREMQAGSVDAVVTDPPYGLEFMGKEWDRLALRADGNPNFRPNGKHVEDRDGEKWRPGSTYGAPKKNPRCRNCNGLKTAPENRPSKCRCETPDWDTRTAEYGRTMQVWHEAWCREAFRVLKPGGHMLAFGGTRTYHRLACAVEDAGFEIRDSLMWVHSQGFPKGKNVERDMAVMTCKLPGRHFKTEANLAAAKEPQPRDHVCPPTPESEPYLGYNVALKPAHEPIVVARKPLSEKNVASQVLATGTGALNIDAARVTISDAAHIKAKGYHKPGNGAVGSGGVYGDYSHEYDGAQAPHEVSTRHDVRGRWPANVLMSHHESCVPVGRRKVRGSNVSGKLPRTGRSVFYNGDNLDKETRQSYADPDGFEEVQAYECARDEEGRYVCPVALLDEQSGTRVGAHGANGVYRQLNYNGGRKVEQNTPRDDKGGASRFFKVFDGEPSSGRWPANVLLSHHPSCFPVGKRKVKSGNSIVEESTASTIKGGLGGKVSRHYADASGFEEVQAYECARDKGGRYVCPVALLDEQSGNVKGAVSNGKKRGSGYHENFGEQVQTPSYADSGGASRFYKVFDGEPPFKYVAKASRAERNKGLEGMQEKPAHKLDGGDFRPEGRNLTSKGLTHQNNHPTVKPLALMRYLVRLVTPPGGVVLDPFAGSGTTGLAAVHEGVGAILIEQESEYAEIARRRIAHAQESVPLTLETASNRGLTPL